MPTCSIAASGSAAKSSRGKIASASDGISGVCSVAGRVGVERAPVRICGVCSVARHVRVERFLEVLPWSNGLFPIESIARNAARKDVDKPKELASTNHASTNQQVGGDGRLCFG